MRANKPSRGLIRQSLSVSPLTAQHLARLVMLGAIAGCQPRSSAPRDAAPAYVDSGADTSPTAPTPPDAASAFVVGRPLHATPAAGGVLVLAQGRRQASISTGSVVAMKRIPLTTDHREWALFVSVAARDGQSEHDRTGMLLRLNPDRNEVETLWSERINGELQQRDLWSVAQTVVAVLFADIDADGRFELLTETRRVSSSIRLTETVRRIARTVARWDAPTARFVLDPTLARRAARWWDSDRDRERRAALAVDQWRSLSDEIECTGLSEDDPALDPQFQGGSLNDVTVRGAEACRFAGQRGADAGSRTAHIAVLLPRATGLTVLATAPLDVEGQPQWARIPCRNSLGSPYIRATAWSADGRERAIVVGVVHPISRVARVFHWDGARLDAVAASLSEQAGCHGVYRAAVIEPSATGGPPRMRVR